MRSHAGETVKESTIAILLVASETQEAGGGFCPEGMPRQKSRNYRPFSGNRRGSGAIP